ncbi:phosphoribosyltransferase family protein [Intrasporangium calvum]|uniref:Phosphoribosyltransferase family protein n=1 Tax=Intrasporangium calvum TaxID=53358 RepID=A0ABT5GDD4_9MICO|nr:phosphoribosyltransferase family protein [Intrasporangium calvum]MDC5696282.1 phosphoribosyltransferase family protein [Intrasporangium calvum]
MAEFRDRADAGAQLAERLEQLRGTDAVVLGLPRGGVPVAAVVAEALDLPLDVIVVRKLGVPSQPELAMGAIGEDGVRFLNSALVERVGVSPSDVEAVEHRERAVLEARVARFRQGRPRLALTGKIAVIVDDGIATGATARVACRFARHLGAVRVVLAVPVAAAESVRQLMAGSEADEVVHVAAPESFYAVGAHYRDFRPTTDDEVADHLERARRRAATKTAGPERPLGSVADTDEDVVIQTGAVSVGGHLTMPAGAAAVVVFAHGSGSSRHSPRNRYVARVLQEAGLGTLLMDLLTSEEEADRANVFDIELLAGRLEAATHWLTQRPDTAAARIGYFGASTGAGAALWAAGGPDSPVAAVVSRGGRPDLAAAHLQQVRAPTLLIVGGRDDVVIDLNRQAQARLTGCESRLVLIEGATHLFEEPGTLAEAAGHARDWFVRHLAGGLPVADRAAGLPEE